MPSKKRKYNARFPAGRIKKIMQTDEEVGKVAQAVPIIICGTPRTLELFVECLLSKALQVTVSRNAKTLNPSHVKQCILAESRFDFLRDLVKNIPDVSVAEEKEMQMSAESSPNSSRFSDTAPRRIVREDSNSSSSSDVRLQQLSRENLPRDHVTRALSTELDQKPKIETITSAIVSTDGAIDLSTKKDEKVVRIANFYQETLVDQGLQRSVITVNPTYNYPQPSTSTYTMLTPVGPMTALDAPKPRADVPKTRVDVPKPRVDVLKTRVDVPKPRVDVPKPRVDVAIPRAEIPKPVTPDITPLFYVDMRQNNNVAMTPPRTPRTPVTPITPIINIDFSKNLENPEIKVLDSSVANIVKEKKLHRQNSKSHKSDAKREPRPIPPVNIDHINSGNLQIDEDYDT